MNVRYRGGASSMARVILIVLVLFLATESGARPFNRRKRVSDQRLAELETLLALARTRGKVVTVPVGFGRIDPQRLGRRKRTLVGEGERVEEEQCLCCTWAKQNPDIPHHAAAGCDHTNYLFHRTRGVNSGSSDLMQFPLDSEASQRPNVIESIEMSNNY